MKEITYPKEEIFTNYGDPMWYQLGVCRNKEGRPSSLFGDDY